MSNEIGWSATPQFRNGVVLQADAGNPGPRVFGNDFNANGTPGEAGDGQNIACNWISIADYFAYLDWAALRPMTEMEFEKACRGGNLLPLQDEFAWGTQFITAATGLLNSGQPDEVPSNAANCAFGNGVQGPLRVGSFAQAGSTRQTSGGSYFGILNLSGNVWEYCIKVGNAQGRAFQGSHGDGELSASGYKTNTDWGNDTGSNHAVALRGSDWLGADTHWLTVSGRYFANWTSDASTRYSTTSIRGVRTAP
jgi:formylglycine-generating enzyme required for sulfatase activity